MADSAQNEFGEELEHFNQMGLRTELLQGLSAYGFEKPAKLQRIGIFPIIRGQDTIVQGQGGSGKTAILAIGTLQKLDIENTNCQALILTPSRELSNQMRNLILHLGHNFGANAYSFIGGVPLRNDTVSLQSGVHVVVGTPGRVFDSLSRCALDPSQIKLFFLDEADEILNRGFTDQVYDVFQYLPPDVQVGLCSATLSTELQELTQKLMTNPHIISVIPNRLSLAGICQFYIKCDHAEGKFDILCDFANILNTRQVLIFCNTNRKVDWLTEQLRMKDFTVSAVCRYLGQDERTKRLSEFRSGSSRFLVTNDFLDWCVNDCVLMVNFEIPKNIELYIRRFGYIMKACGTKRIGINLVVEEDFTVLRQIEAYYNMVIDEMPSDITFI